MIYDWEDHKEDGKLYTISYVRPPKILGSWYEAEPYHHPGKTKRLNSEEEIIEKFILVSEE